MRSLTWPQVWARRLGWHHLLQPAPAERLVDVSGELCGIHAQVMAAAELSIGIRVAGATRRSVQDDLWKRRRLVKTYGIRGTIHLFPAHELAMWMAAQRANPTLRDEGRLRRQGLSPEQLDVLVGAIGEALDGRRLSREDLGREIGRLVGPWAVGATMPAFGTSWPRWMGAVRAAAWAGRLCFGPNDRNQVTFVRADKWTDSWSVVDPWQALAEVCLRYLAAYGPATADNFAQWFGVGPPLAREVVASLRDRLEAVNVEGSQAWLPIAHAGDPCEAVPASVRLVPHYDCYVIGCHPRDMLIPPPWQARAMANGVTGPIPLLVVDGVVAGIWKRQSSSRRVEITVQPFRSLTHRERELLREEAERMGQILEVEVLLSIVGDT